MNAVKEGLGEVKYTQDVDGLIERIIETNSNTILPLTLHSLGGECKVNDSDSTQGC